MLLGGMKVVGIYIWASDSAFKNSTFTLCQVNFISFSIGCFGILMFLSGALSYNLDYVCTMMNFYMRHY